MLLPLPEPEPQFCDANGVPFSGGTIATYIPGTDTPADTWSDMAGTALNTNPIVLDAAGRALIYGAGDYRFVLKDVAGNLIYDQLTSAIDKSTLVTMAEVNTAVQAETDRAEAAEAAETSRAEAAEANLQSQITAEVARAEAAEHALDTRVTALEGAGTTAAPTIQYGTSITNSSGLATVTFATAYTSTPMVVATVWGSSLGDEWLQVDPTTTGFSVFASQPLAGSTLGGAAVGFMWIAAGT